MGEKINLARLSNDERAEYERLSRAVQEAEEPSHPRALLHPENTPGLWALGGWVALTALTGLWLLSMNTASEPGTFSVHGSSAAGAVMALFVVVLLGGAVLVFVILVRGVRSWRNKNLMRAREEVSDFLVRIGYQTRQRRLLTSDDSPMSKRQSQHLWYGSHSELGWQDRVRAEQLGIGDVETYISNVLENDKD